MKINKIKLIPRLLIFTILLTSAIWLGCDSKKSNKDTAVSEIAVDQVADEKALETNLINPEAMSLLKRGTNYLSGLNQFSVQTQSSYEDVLEIGYRVDFESSGNVLVNRPNQIRINQHGVGMHQIFYFDGQSFTLNNPNDKVYAVESLTGSIEDMFHLARDNFGLGAPASDLIYSNSFSLLIQDVNFAEFMGKEMIGEVRCDHLLFNRPDVSFQIWISEKEPYLPYKYVVTDTTDENLLSFTTIMSNWNTAPEISDDQFNFVPSKDISKIVFLPKDTEKQ